MFPKRALLPSSMRKRTFSAGPIRQRYSQSLPP